MFFMGQQMLGWGHLLQSIVGNKFLPVCVQQLAGQSSSSTLHIKTEELSRQYRDQLSTMREEKDREIQRLRVSHSLAS